MQQFTSKTKHYLPTQTKEEMEHVYYCEYLNKEKTEVRYEEMYGENINEIKLILRKQDWPRYP